MPIVTITLRKPKSRDFKATILEAVHAALVGAGVHPDDRFHRVLELDAEDFQYDATFPDVPWENWSPAGGRMPHAWTRPGLVRPADRKHYPSACVTRDALMSCRHDQACRLSHPRLSVLPAA